MPPAYLIAEIDVKDPDTYARYREAAPASVAKYGGEYLVRGGRMEVVEGGERLPRIVVLRFPSFEQAKAWYTSEDYAPLRDLRLSATDSRALMVEGFDPAA